MSPIWEVHPSEQICRIIDRIYRRGFTTTTGGNISIKDDQGNIWITPAAIDKGSLTPSDMIMVTPDGSFYGKHKPSSEYPFHRSIYDKRSDIRAVVHAHPPALVSFSIVHQVPDTRITSQARFTCGQIGYASYELPGSIMLGEKIAMEFQKGYHAIILENHGTVVCGENMEEAYRRFESLEYCASTLLYAKSIGEPVYLNDEQLTAYKNQLPEQLPEMTDTDKTPDNAEKRTEICRFVQRACQQGLMISSFGTVSVRCSETDFLITPGNLSRWDMQADDMVLIKNGRREAGKSPSKSVWLHHEIYRKHPYINSIIITQPPYLMAHAVTHTWLDVRTIPESWIFLQDIPLLAFGSHFVSNCLIPDHLSENTPAVLIANDSVIVTGDTLLQTFDRLEVAEFSAKSLILAKPAGKLIPMNNQQIEDLRRVYLKK